MSSKDYDKEHLIHSKSGNIKIMIYDKADDIRISQRFGWHFNPSSGTFEMVNFTMN